MTSGFDTFKYHTMRLMERSEFLCIASLLNFELMKEGSVSVGIIVLNSV